MSSWDNVLDGLSEFTGEVGKSLAMMQAGTSMMNDIDSVEISDFCDHNGYNYKTMLRHINLTISQFSFLTSFTGAGAAAGGIGTNVSKDSKFDYTYTQSIDYVNNYQEIISSKEKQGLDTTSGILNAAMRDHVGSYKNINQLYQTSINSYPDENGSGTWGINGGSKWKTSSNFGILYKTKKLFKDRKINTIISRFHTENKDAESTTSETSAYGLSHGRNLLTYDAETTGSRYPVNGYDNPYCRVWTHHHKYDSMSRLIRPFAKSIGPNGEYAVPRGDVNEWSQFGTQKMRVMADISKGNDNKDIDHFQDKEWGWRKDGADSFKYSVLNNNTGMLNIAPQFKGGGEFNIHTKDCMFSIENLAWQGYDPYSFENALSWEQRGPFGGRIMWFPPYGLTFNEDTSVNWNEHTFIGRGESVYTYTNTSRSGSLSFKLVVDHPSIIDYATWYKKEEDAVHNVDNPQNTLTDTDLLRFFAGCEKPGVSLTDKAKPTPLTDEYIKETEEINTKEADKPVKEEPPTEENAPEPTEDEVIYFYAFFPNNYSGAYDRKDGEGVASEEYRTKTNVDPIAYLLYGYGAQEMTTEEGEKYQEKVNTILKSGYHDSIEIDFDYPNVQIIVGNGYEMGEVGISSDISDLDITDSIIIGCTNNFKEGGSKTYTVAKIPGTDVMKLWHYRIDGCYSTKDGNSTWNEKNCFGQTLLIDKNGKKYGTYEQRYKDVTSEQLNSSHSSLCKNKIKDVEAKEQEKYYTLAEIALIHCIKEDKQEVRQNILYNTTLEPSEWLQDYDNLHFTEERLNKLKELLDENKYELVRCEVEGEASFQGEENERGKKRNKFLGKQRAITVKKWVEQILNGGKTLEGETSSKEIKKPEGYVEYVESHVTQKAHRCARATLHFKRVKKVERVTEKFNSDDSIIKNYLNELHIPQRETESSTAILNNGLQERTGEWQTSGDGYYTNPNPIPAKDFNGNYIMWQKDEKGEGIPETERSVSREWLDILNDAEYTYVTDYYRALGYEPKMVKDTRKWKEIKNEDGTKKMVTDNVYSRFSYDENAENSYALINGISKKNVNNEYNHLRYDQEYYFFKQLELNDKPMYDSLVKKLHFFNPAFHSMTPEGFMGRLTFLHQCTRQGNTIGASDENGMSANNLAFGRPPFCVLRLGDFYYQKIVIKSISINYDPLVWDLNQEGAGVVPMLADVTINFNFIGGGDMTGAVRRLQNAMSFNYYANTRLYDNRADRVTYKYDHKTNGALDHSLDLENSDLYLTKMYK